MPTDQTAAREAIEKLKRYCRPSHSRALLQLANTAIPFVLIWALMVKSLQWSYALTLLLAVVNAFLFIRLFIFQHDCGHGSFFSSQKANDILGSILGCLTLIPYHYWRKTHAIHHATHGDLSRRGVGDVDTLTVREFEAMSRLGRFGYRLQRHPLILLTVGPIYQFLLKHRLPLDAPFSWRREWRSVHLTNVVLVAVTIVMASTIGLGAFVAVHLPIALIAGAIGVYLFYVQHQFEETFWEDPEQWDFYRAAVEGSSFFDLPPALHWLTGNIGYHHIHHLASRIPNYHLPRCLRENPELREAARKLTLRSSWGCMKLKLWDEESRRLIEFGEWRRRQATA